MVRQDSPLRQGAGGFEREAARRLPSVLAELLDAPEPKRGELAAHDGWLDAIFTDDRGREWGVGIEPSSAPGVVARAAKLLEPYKTSPLIPALVVPFMTPAGALAAAARDLNWIDLSGNAHVRADQLFISREGRPNAFPVRGRPASAFAPVSARVARVLLNDPARWWRQRDLAVATGLDDGRVSKIVRRLSDDHLLERRGHEVRPLDPELLLDAWADDYRFDRHDIVLGHASGNGIELARGLSERLTKLGIRNALTGLPAAWLLDRFASFRLTTIYVEGDPRDAAERLELRQNERGANVQLVGPNDLDVMSGGAEIDGVSVASPPQIYLDLLALPERAREAAEHLRSSGRLWST